MVTAEAVVDEIVLVLEKKGSRVVKVDRAAYLRAKQDGSLPWFIDTYAETVDYDVTVTEPDGTTYNPYWMPDE